MKTITLRDEDVLELGLLRDRLERARRDSHKPNSAVMDMERARSNDLDREVEVLNRVMQQCRK